MDIKEGYQEWSIRVFTRKQELGAKANVNEELDQELHEKVIKKLKRSKVYARLKDNIWVADLAEKRSLSSKN